MYSTWHGNSAEDSEQARDVMSFGLYTDHLGWTAGKREAGRSHYQVIMVAQTGGGGGLGWDAGSGDGVRQSKRFKLLCLSEI